MRTLLVLSLALSTLTPTVLCSSRALAQDDGPTRVETFDDADLVSGTIEAPVGEQIRSRRLGARHTLITPRAHYNAEMLRSVETL